MLPQKRVIGNTFYACSMLQFFFVRVHTHPFHSNDLKLKPPLFCAWIKGHLIWFQDTWSHDSKSYDMKQQSTSNAHVV